MVTIVAVGQPEPVRSRWQDVPGNLDRLAKGEPDRLIPVVGMHYREHYGERKHQPKDGEHLSNIHLLYPQYVDRHPFRLIPDNPSLSSFSPLTSDAQRITRVRTGGTQLHLQRN